MRSQDVLLLLKLISLHAEFAEKDVDSNIIKMDDTWADWDDKGSGFGSSLSTVATLCSSWEKP